MDWDFAIKRKRRELVAIVATLMSMVAACVSSDGRKAVLRILRPAESALRRLIVIYQRENGVRRANPNTSINPGLDPGVQSDVSFQADKPENKEPKAPLDSGIKSRNDSGAFKHSDRSLPNFSAFDAMRADYAPSFRLIDPRKRFGWADDEAGPSAQREGPRIWAPGMVAPQLNPPVASVDPEAAPGMASIKRRITALEHALKTLPAQAKRLSRLLEKRAKAPPGPGSVGSIRPGLPPGWRRKQNRQVDFILADCHGLAMDSMARPP